tara:strand:+ start:105 stop:317 length:213 start_codon:yes stop_codon:yes gene_type:complete
MNKNIWMDFARVNGMSPSEFFSELTVATMAAMAVKLDESELDAIKVTHGKYTLILVDNEKADNNINKGKL